MTAETHPLTELRHRLGLTRQELANEAKVSERQLARIETDHAQARKATLARLAKALDVDVEVISGERPLPAPENKELAQEIDPQNLKALRKGKGLSRSALAAKAGVSERQLARLESPGPKRKVRATTFKRLANALGADVNEISGAVPVAPKLAPREDGGTRRVRVSPQVRLAYDLIQYRYGPTLMQILELAPLLFVLLAEGSLAWRRERLAEVDEAIKRLDELSEDSQLYFASCISDVEAGRDCEGDSIANADLLGEDVQSDESVQSLGMDTSRVEPFATYLRKMAEDIGMEGGIVDFDPPYREAVDPTWGGRSYEVCRDTLGELAGDSTDARWALAHGDVRVSQIPKDLLEPEAKDQRIAWLESRLSDDTRDHMEALEAIEKWIDQLRSETASRPAGT